MMRSKSSPFLLMLSLLFYVNLSYAEDEKVTTPPTVPMASSGEKDVSEKKDTNHDEDRPLVEVQNDATSDQAGFLNVSSIKEVIEADQLAEVVREKNKQLEVKKQEELTQEQKLYLFPSEDDLFQFISEYWVVKNAQILGFDVDRPDYGIVQTFTELLERLGYVHKNYRILLIDNSVVTHYALPSSKNDYFFLLSLPFIRTMDLSKMEIALLLFEDFLRHEKQYFKKYVFEKELDEWLDKSFYEKKTIKKELIEKIVANYNLFIFQKGFTFQQQYEITSSVLKNIDRNEKLVETYKNLLYKIDALVKINPKFKDYAKVYPSPELQLNWLNAHDKKF